jgi:hypothetical protein
MTHLIFSSKTIADTICQEIAATPDIEGGSAPCWLWFDPDAPTNQVQYAQGADGRCAVAHPFNAVDRAWLETYCDSWITAGQMQILDALPANWQYQQVP